VNGRHSVIGSLCFAAPRLLKLNARSASAISHFSLLIPHFHLFDSATPHPPTANRQPPTTPPLTTIFKKVKAQHCGLIFVFRRGSIEIRNGMERGVLRAVQSREFRVVMGMPRSGFLNFTLLTPHFTLFTE